MSILTFLDVAMSQLSPGVFKDYSVTSVSRHVNTMLNPSEAAAFVTASSLLPSGPGKYQIIDQDSKILAKI